MKTKVKVLIEMEIEHTDKMSEHEIDKLALENVFFSSISGCSIDYGSYSSKLLKRFLL